jgi:ribonuclease BN (tRNA processing enzyme)
VNWRLHVLGASSTRTPPGDANASLALANGERVILIDAGGDLPARLERAGLNPRNVTDVIVTHSHPDHTYGLPFLSHSFYHGHSEITCWSTEEAIPRLRDSLEAYDLQEPDKYMDVQFESIPVTDQSDLPLSESLTVTSFPAKHSRDAFGLRLESDRQKIVFSGDTEPCSELRDIGGNAEVLIHDCQGLHGYQRYYEGSHTSALELGRIASDLSVNVLVPFHHNLVEVPGGWNEIGSEIREHFDGSIVYPRQGMGFVL